MIMAAFFVWANDLSVPADQFQIITTNLLILKIGEQVYKGLKFS
jgi:hypothetical protein